MTKVIFYEKPGCIGNEQQKALLARSGHKLDVRDMTTIPWTPEMLRSFFGSRPVHLWFNQSSPRLKSGEICTDKINEIDALALMCQDPLLIRRPLLEVNGRREIGFETSIINDWIGLDMSASAVGEGCPKSNM
ncbi:MAG: hypothetical protein TECD_00283 [Hyphomicrobiaceae bacterium hypho_1]